MGTPGTGSDRCRFDLKNREGDRNTISIYVQVIVKKTWGNTCLKVKFHITGWDLFLAWDKEISYNKLELLVSLIFLGVLGQLCLWTFSNWKATYKLLPTRTIIHKDHYPLGLLSTWGLLQKTFTTEKKLVKSENFGKHEFTIHFTTGKKILIKITRVFLW